MILPNSPYHARAVFCSSPSVEKETISIVGNRKWRRLSSWSCTALISVALLLTRHHGGLCARLDADAVRRLQRDNTLSHQPRRQPQQQVRVDHPCGGSNFVVSDVIDDTIPFDRRLLHQQPQQHQQPLSSFGWRFHAEVFPVGVENGQEHDEGPDTEMTSSRPQIHGQSASEGDARNWLAAVRDMLERLCRDVERFRTHYVRGHA